jgi:anti-anti-sigma factor
VAEPPRSNVLAEWHCGGDVLVVALSGHPTADCSERLLDSVRGLPFHRPMQVVVDLSNVIAIDRGGASALLDAYVAMNLRGGSLVLTGLTEDVRESLRQAGVLQRVESVPSECFDIGTPKGHLRLVHGNHVQSTEIPT